jgi:hypothetical protein
VSVTSFGQFGLFAWALAPWPQQADLPRSQCQYGFPCHLARLGRYIDNFPAKFWHVIQAVVERATILQSSIVIGSDQQFGLDRSAGKLLVNVTLSIGNHHHACRSMSCQFCRHEGGAEPAVTLLICKCPHGPLALFAADMLEEHRLDEPEQSPVIGIDRDHRVKIQTVELAIVSQRRGVLDRQNMATSDQPRGSQPGRGYHLLRRHPPIAQETRDADLASPISANTPNTDPRLTDADKAGQQTGPPFSRRRSPNRPNPPSIARSIGSIHPDGFRLQTIWQAADPPRCVNMLGLDRGTQYSRGFSAQAPAASRILDRPVKPGDDRV